MTTSINALHLSRSALGLIEQLETKPATRIAAAVNEWNTCVDQAGFTGTFDFPTTGYTRKAQVIADLKRCVEQLNEIRIEADRNTGRPVDEDDNGTPAWSGNDIEAAHAEALDINRWIDDAHCVGGVAFEGAADAIIAVRERAHDEALEEEARFNWLANRFGVFWASTARVRLEMLDEAHAEAMVIDEEWNAKARHARWCAFIGGNDHKARRAIVAAAHAEAIAEDAQRTFAALPPFSQAVAFVEAHDEALRMNEEITFVREFETLTYEQAIAYSDQQDFDNATPEAQAQMVEAAHAEAMETDKKATFWKCRESVFYGKFDATQRQLIIDETHGVALRVDALITALARKIRGAITSHDGEEGIHVIAVEINADRLNLPPSEIAFAAEQAARAAGMAK